MLHSCPKCEFKSRLNSLSAVTVAKVSTNSWKTLVVQRILLETCTRWNCPSASSMSCALVTKTVAYVLLTQPDYHPEWPFYWYGKKWIHLPQ